MNELILTGCMQGLILALVAFGVMVPLRLLNFADLTAEGTYPLGGAVCASLIMMGGHPIAAVVIAVIAAGLVGMATALIHLRFQVNTLLAGIILSTMLYSVNLRLMGKPNIALFNMSLLFDSQSMMLKIVMMLTILAGLLIPLSLFLQTEFGLRIRAVGLNPEFSQRQGLSVARYTLLGLFLGNAYAGVAGALTVQLQNYMDINMGVGIIIHALAALMLGECIVNNKTIKQQLLAPLVGALVYQQIQGLAISLGLAHSDLKLLTGIIVLTIIALRGKKI